MTTEGLEGPQNPELVGDRHVVFWYSIKDYAGIFLNDLEKSLERRNPSFKAAAEHRWVYDLGHSGRGYHDFPPNFTLNLLQIAEHAGGLTTYKMSGHQFVTELETKLSEYMGGDREEMADWTEGKPKSEIERLNTIRDEMEKNGDIVYDVRFRKSLYPISSFLHEEPSDLGGAGGHWFEPQPLDGEQTNTEGSAPEAK